MKKLFTAKVDIPTPTLLITREFFFETLQERDMFLQETRERSGAACRAFGVCYVTTLVEALAEVEREKNN
jgi:hypothetical protein